MGKIVLAIILLFVLLSVIVAAIPESNETLLSVCYSNVQKPLYRQLNNITDPDWGAWCRQKYP